MSNMQQFRQSLRDVTIRQSNSRQTTSRPPTNPQSVSRLSQRSFAILEAPPEQGSMANPYASIAQQQDMQDYLEDEMVGSVGDGIRGSSVRSYRAGSVMDPAASVMRPTTALDRATMASQGGRSVAAPSMMGGAMAESGMARSMAMSRASQGMGRATSPCCPTPPPCCPKPRPCPTSGGSQCCGNDNMSYTGSVRGTSTVGRSTFVRPSTKNSFSPDMNATIVAINDQFRRASRMSRAMSPSIAASRPPMRPLSPTLSSVSKKQFRIAEDANTEHKLSYHPTDTASSAVGSRVGRPMSMASDPRASYRSEMLSRNSMRPQSVSPSDTRKTAASIRASSVPRGSTRMTGRATSPGSMRSQRFSAATNRGMSTAARSVTGSFNGDAGSEYGSQRRSRSDMPVTLKSSVAY